jgi:hypothetical protein
VIAGLILRFVFSGKAGTPWAAMSGAFIYLTPIAVGAVTVYLAERERRRTWGYYLVAPFWATAFFVLGTLLIMIEGLICAIVIMPMFGFLGAIGGLVMGIICRLTNWPRASVYSLASAPLVAALALGGISEPDHFGWVERSRIVRAPASAVWAQIVNTEPIPHAEMQSAWAMRIGVPAPIVGRLELKGGEHVRRTQWGKGVYFDEVVTHWDEPRFLRWTYRFHPDSFPAHALDDHVLIGGHYFDLLETQYELTPTPEGTKLTTRTRYRISTHFNFYSDWVAQLVVGDLNEKGLALFARRAERASTIKKS